MLSDLQDDHPIVEAFTNGAFQVDLTCPECGGDRSYTRRDLKLFLTGGKEVDLEKGRLKSGRDKHFQG